MTTVGQKIKKVQGKKKIVKSNKSKFLINQNFSREITFFAVLNFSPVQKIIFGHF